MKVKRRFIKDHVNVDEVRVMIGKGMGWETIAKRYGFSKDKTRKYCHTHGIYMKGKRK